MDTAQYESVKNRTVLFFYERLIEKGGRRSLHDLSCQFGAKEFTNDMRRIAGGTESSLRKFLSERPHLFTLDGDMVNIKKRDAPTRDIREEAVQYFSNKLRQYGEGTEVPIKTLFGHRSQASREIRHICGQQIDEFRTFLSMNSNDFILYEDNVKLKEYACTKPQPEPEAVKVDSAASSHLLNFFKLCIDIEGPLPADQLYNHVQTLFPEDVWSPIFKTPQDLLSFIRIHSNLFNVRARTIYSAQRTDCKYIKSNTNINNNNDINNNNSGSSITTASSPPVVPTENITDSSINFRKTALAKGVNSSVRKVQAATAGNDGNIASVSVQEDNWNAQVLQRTKIIANTKECLDLVEDILASEERTVISFDCKGINLGEKGLITQIEIGLTNGEAYILDLVTSPNLVVAGGLKRLLQSKKVLKVIHDCSSVSLNLYNQYGITLNNVFDTQAAYAVLQLQFTGEPVHKVKTVTLNALCELYGAPINPHKETLKALYRTDKRFWARRPLTRDMLVYGAADVLSLVPQLYNAMLKELRKDMEPLLWELCDEQVLMHIKPDEVKERKKQRKLDSEVSDLRAKLTTSAHSGRNIVLTNRERRLLLFYFNVGVATKQHPQD